MSKAPAISRFAIALLVATQFFLLPCTSARADDTRPLVLWTSEIHADRLSVIRFLVDVYKVLGPGVDVEVVSVEENELVERFEQAKERNETPDIVSTGCDLITALGECGKLDLAAADELLDRIGKDRFYHGPLEQMAAPGGRRHYGVPYHGWIQGIWYRADWFRDAGLDPPATWESLLKAARHFHAPDKGTYGILLGNSGSQYSEQIFTHLALAAGARMFTPSGKLAFNTKRMTETLAFYKQLAAFTPPGEQHWRGRDFYLQGKLAMFFYSTFIMDDLALPAVAANSLTGDNFPELSGTDFDPNLVRNTRFVPIISHRDAAGYGMINGFALPAGNAPERVLAAQEFLEFLFEPDQYVAWMHMAPGGMLPAVRDVMESDAFMRDPLGVFARYGRPRIREIHAGLERTANFALVDGKRNPLASVFYSERIIPKMIMKVVHDNMEPKAAVQWAENEMREVAAETDKNR